MAGLQTEVMNLTQLWDQLDRHDWFYNYSDDHRVWSAGLAEESRLRAEAGRIPGGTELYESFAKHHFSGEPWKTPKQPKPERPS